MTMDLFTRRDLDQCLANPDAWSVSIYMPANRRAAGGGENAVRFKNVLRRAEEQLRAVDLDPETFLAPARKLLERPEFWSHQADGLAVLAQEDFFRAWRLPREFNELVAVGRGFHVKPLLPLAQDDGHFFILALSQASARFFTASRFGADETDIEGLPLSLDEALRYDDPERQVQFHTGAGATGGAGGGERAAVFHGQGVDDAKDQLTRFCRAVDKTLRPVLAEERAPLVLAGVDHLIPTFCEVSRYGAILSEHVSGNPDEWGADDLFQRAWPLVEPVFEARSGQALERFAALVGTGKASSDPLEVAPAAWQGRVEVLFTPVGLQGWGTFDPESQQAVFSDSPNPGDADLFNLAAVQTLRQGGAVFALDPDRVPGGRGLAAIYRY